MGIFGSNYKASDYYWRNSDEYFILSDINSKFLKRNNFTGTVSDFKNRVRKSKPYTRVRTGSANFNYRYTPVYRIQDFKHGHICDQ